MTPSGPGGAPDDGDPDKTVTSGYIADLTQEVAGLARRSQREIVAYLQDVVQSGSYAAPEPPASPMPDTEA